jgi:hypothetical protein
MHQALLGALTIALSRPSSVDDPSIARDSMRYASLDTDFISSLDKQDRNHGAIFFIPFRL